MRSSAQKRTPWWIAFVTAALCFVAVDYALARWTPAPARLPESFSPAYFERYVDSWRSQPNLIVVLGDSVLWGYKLPVDQSLPALLAKRLPQYHVIDLAYEGGSTTNSEMLVRYLLARGVKPALVVFNVNTKEMNPIDSAYRRLQPSVEKASQPLLDARDREQLLLLPSGDFNQKLGRLVERYWLLYRYRIDLRQAIFGADDMAAWATALVQRATGYAGRAAAAHRPTESVFLGTYDLTPLDEKNVAFARMQRMAAELRRAGVPSVAFLTPANHPLLHAYIDAPEYDDNLKRIRTTLSGAGVRVIDADKAVPGDEFIDNDHLTAKGNVRLLHLLLPQIEAAQR